jgi:4-carboxymuconolactone decarboxylase
VTAEGTAVNRLGALLRLSAALGSVGRDDWAEVLAETAAVAEPGAIDEVILQAHLFAGFPTVLNVFTVWRRLHPETTSTADPSLEERRSAGEDLCREIYGAAYERLRAHVAGLHPDLDRWAIEEGYGKTLSRPGLSPVERELCVVALLTAAGQEPQLRSHLRGALNVGAMPVQIERALSIGIDTRSEARAAEPVPQRLRGVWDDIKTRTGVE